MIYKKTFLIIIYILILYCFSVSVFLIYYSNKNYNENDLIYLQNNVLIINKSYLTNYSYDNKLLSGDKIFVIVDLDNNPLIYIIPKSYVRKQMLISYDYNHNDLDRNIYVKLNPIRLNYNYNETIVKLNKVVNIKDVIDNFGIKSFEIKDKFNYKYFENNKEVTSIIKSNDKTILKLEIINDKLSDNFDNYVSIKYSYNDKVYVSDLKNKTPYNIDNYLYYEADSNIREAKEIWLDIKNRSEIYKFILK